MPKIKPNSLDILFLDDIIEEKKKGKHKKKKTKKKDKKKHKKKKKQNKKKNKSKKNKKKNKVAVKGYIKSIDETANELYDYKYNKTLGNKILDSFKVNLDVSIKDKAIASAIDAGIYILKNIFAKKS